MDGLTIVADTVVAGFVNMITESRAGGRAENPNTETECPVRSLSCRRDQQLSLLDIYDNDRLAG
jgi:hypothetical protein